MSRLKKGFNIVQVNVLKVFFQFSRLLKKTKHIQRLDTNAKGLFKVTISFSKMNRLLS